MHPVNRAGLTSAALVAVLLSISGCAHGPAATWLLLPEETALADLRQITFGGENAEAYWSFDGKALSLQARHETAGVPCDRIYRMPVFPKVEAPVQLSSGLGSTTCPHFLPGGDLLYASTHLGGPACPAKPDMSKGYVWGLFADYDIFKIKGAAGAKGPVKDADAVRLTSTPGYDAEGTVCGRDGSIVFTSVRDGDLELYRMDAEGKNVRRLTHTIGYDGGAFFNRDCTRLVWRASRPRPGKEQEDYKALLAEGLVRPSKLEIWVANADGTEPHQLTDLDAASFAPFFHPTEDVIIFSSNVGDPRGREFDLWAMHGNGTGLRRITFAPGFDGFPHFTPDGKTIAFSSNRATAPGAHDTNLFLATWKGLEPLAEVAYRPADRIARDIVWLADPVREGRGIGTTGLAAAGAYLEERLKRLGAEPAGDVGQYRQAFPVVTSVALKPGATVSIGGTALGPADFSPLGFSGEGKVTAPLVLAGYGIVAKENGIDDYAGLDVKGKIALVRRFAPEDERTKDAATRRGLGDLRRKAWTARERGAVGLLVVDWPLPPSQAPPDWQPAAEAPLGTPSPTGAGDAGLPVLMVKRASVNAVMPSLLGKKAVTAALDIALAPSTDKAFNVIGRFPAAKPGARSIVIGAHYDHLGMGGRYSLAPNAKEPHVGADDNASGTAALLEIARAVSEKRAELSHDIVIAFFSGEESGLLGSSHYTRGRGADLGKDVRAMINLDMVGRLREGKLDVLGGESALEWAALVRAACNDLRLSCTLSGDGQGPSDQASFYAAGIPVLHFFTGTHSDYHKPSDTAARIFPVGAATVADLTLRVLRALDAGVSLTYQKGKSAPPGGDSRSFNASLGTIPDYAGPPGGKPGVLLGGVRPGGAADKAGMVRGDVLVKLGSHEIRSVEDLMYALQASKPGETVKAVVVRAGKNLELETTFQEAKRAP